MQITSDIEKAAELAQYADATKLAQDCEAHTGYDTRIDSTAEGYVVRVLDEEGDALGWIAS